MDIEGQLMRNMLKFQRRKIDKSMHRGLLRQIIRRVTAAFESNRVQKVQRKMDNKDRLELYNENSPKSEMHTQAKKTVVDQKKEKQEDKVQTRMEQTIRQPKGARWEQKKLYSHNHAPRYNHKQRKSKGIHP